MSALIKIGWRPTAEVRRAIMELKQIINTISRVDGRRKLQDCRYTAELQRIDEDGYCIYLSTFCRAIDVNSVAKMILRKLSHFGVTKFRTPNSTEFEVTEKNILMNFERWLSVEQHLGIFFSVKF